jgi:hypothetical protein
VLPDRQYADIGKRNIFVGGLPPLPPPEKKKKEEKKPPVVKKDPEPESPKQYYVPDYVYITTCVPELQTAYLRNRLFDSPTTKELPLMAKAGTGYDIFTIAGPETDIGRYIYFRAKVLKVELRQIFFQVGDGMDPDFIRDGVYSLQIGQALASAKFFSENYSKIDLEDLGLYSREFEKAEQKLYLDRTKKNGKDSKDNKGRPTKGRPAKN